MTSVTTASAPTADSNALARLTQWIKGHRKVATYVAVALIVGAGLYGWSLLTAKTAELNAGRQLEQGRLAFDSKNYPLAASVLSQMVENFSGTPAAQEGALLLAQVRLAQGQTMQAIDVLQRYAPKAAKDFQAQAYGLLGAAYENALKAREAAAAYQHAADAAQYPFLRAQFLSDAGRAWTTAGDTAKALAAYRSIIEKLDSSSAVGEAKVRVGELTRGAGLGAK